MQLSNHFKSRKPSAIRVAHIEFMKRKDNVKAINTAIGNVSLPMHPAMQSRMFDLNSEDSPFKDGVVKYSATVGFEETQKAFLNVISSSNFDTKGLYVQITEGGSQAMELIIVGVCGDAGTDDSPLLLIDAAYTNYMAFAQRVGRKTISVMRHLDDKGKFTLPNIAEIERIIEKHRPGAIVVIPYDNPTGHFYDHKSMVELGKLCVKHKLWMISDEAYRELHYVDHETVSVWGLSEKEVPGITGRRISIETSSKVWNACGLRIGAIVTDNKEFHERGVAENTANLCPNVIGQYIFGALAHETKKDLIDWYASQRKYYYRMLQRLTVDLKKMMPELIISNPDASIYQVIDVRRIAPEFDSYQFVLYCAREGKVKIDGVDYTLLVSPMEEFYNIPHGSGIRNPGKSQMRIAYVETPKNMELFPRLFFELFKQFNSKKK